MARIVQSLRAAMPVDGVFLQLHGVMFAEGVGAGETLLVERLVPGTPRMAVVRIGGVHAILSEEAPRRPMTIAAGRASDGNSGMEGRGLIID